MEAHRRRRHRRGRQWRRKGQRPGGPRVGRLVPAPRAKRTNAALRAGHGARRGCDPDPVDGDVTLMQPDWFPWLSILIFLPPAGAGALYLAPERHARTIALATTVLDVLVALPLWWLFNPSSSRMQFVEHVAWVTSPPLPSSRGIR